MIHVLWLSYHANVPTRGYWDQGLLMRLFAAQGYQDVFGLADIPEGQGAIVCLPAKAHEHDIPRLNADLARLPWVLLILAEDECGDFNSDLLDHPNMRVWVQTPWPGRYQRVDHALPVYWRVECPEEMAKHRPEKDLDWCFAGQITHQRRKDCARALATLPLTGGETVATSVFGARPDEGGLSYPDYCALMARARVVPCPSGNVTPDSFRVWETLEAGGVPVVDYCSPRPDYPAGYWDRVAPGNPFFEVDDWDLFPAILEDRIEDWQWHAVTCGAWWLRHKRDLRTLLEDTLAALGAPEQARAAITVLIPTSPIPDHPSVAHIVETVNSIRQYPELSEIIITCDGVRPEQEELREQYLEYVRDLIWHANHVWDHVLVVVHEEYLHQVEMARRALPLVRTEAILYVEHDTPLCDPIPWDGLVAALTWKRDWRIDPDGKRWCGTCSEVEGAGSMPCGHCDCCQCYYRLDVIRLYHETAIPHEHGYLHRGEVEIGGHQFERTVQWSQRPHLARREWYAQMLDANFSPEARTFIEDKMHSVAQSPRWPGRIGIYLPPGDSIRRSRHTDGRGGASKFDGGLVF